MLDHVRRFRGVLNKFRNNPGLEHDFSYIQSYEVGYEIIKLTLIYPPDDSEFLATLKVFPSSGRCNGEIFYSECAAIEETHLTKRK